LVSNIDLEEVTSGVVCSLKTEGEGVVGGNVRLGPMGANEPDLFKNSL